MGAGGALASLAIAILASAATGAEPPAPRDVARLVRALGSPNYAKREHATQELIRLGTSSRAALVEAARDADAEVRLRAREILAQVDRDDFCRRLEAFVAAYDDNQRELLPSWNEFAARFGDGREARGLFAEMQRAEPELLAAHALGPNAGSEALDGRCRTLFDEIATRTSYRDTITSLGTLAGLMFVGSAEGVTIAPQQAVYLNDWISSPLFHWQLRYGKFSTVLRRILAAWIYKDVTPQLTPQNLANAADYGLKAEGLAVATRLLSRDRRSSDVARLPTMCYYTLMTVGTFGGAEHVPLVEPFLADPSDCGNAQVDDPPRQVPLKVCDVALAVLLNLTGQDPQTYGAPLKRKMHVSFRVPLVIFGGPEQREIAMAQWHAWRAEHSLMP